MQLLVHYIFVFWPLYPRDLLLRAVPQSMALFVLLSSIQLVGDDPAST
jgi:hypothetical protein